MESIAIDLTWVRPNKVGGTESCIRNLLEGFSQIEIRNLIIILLVTKDNAASFEKYNSFDCFQIDVCDVNSSSQRERVIWQNTKMGHHLKDLGVKYCLEPVYGKPFFGVRGITFITTIHDLQAIHYPQYFSKGRVAWMRISWLNAVITSKKIIAISQFVKSDIERYYPQSIDKTVVIYDALNINTKEISDTKIIDELNIKSKQYYYTVSSMFLHKNLKTIVLAMAELKRRNSPAFYPLIVSGIGGRKRNELDRLIKDNDLTSDIIFTSFVSNSERNMLYKNCRAFLFPSIFEGFGMPPLEAASFGTPVLTTRCTSIEEVSGGLLNYVDEPLDPVEWANKLERELRIVPERDINELLYRYDNKIIAEQYISLFKNL